MSTCDYRHHEVETHDRSISLFDRLQLAHPYPLTTMIELTERCNLACPHCYIPKPKVIDELSIYELTRVMDQLADVGVLRLTLTGGEPGLRPDLKQIISEAAARRFAISIKTNATVFNDKDVEDLFAAGLSEMDTSLYHFDPQAHDRFVGLPGAWHRTVSSLMQFKALGGRSHVAILAMDWNTGGILGLVDFCEQRGWSRHVDLRINVRTDGATEPAAFRAGEHALIALASDDRFYDEQLVADDKPLPLENPLCVAARGTICIKPNGDVWPCVSLPWSMGNLRELSVREIWDDSPIRKRVLSFKRKDAKRCSGCAYGVVCARCLASAFLENGDVNEPSALDCGNARVWFEARRHWRTRLKTNG